MIIYNFSIDTMLGKSRFLDLTAVNMQKNEFLATFWFYTLTDSIPLKHSNSLLCQHSNLLTLQLNTSTTHLLTDSPTLPTIALLPRLFTFGFIQPANVTYCKSLMYKFECYYDSCWHLNCFPFFHLGRWCATSTISFLKLDFIRSYCNSSLAYQWAPL